MPIFPLPPLHISAPCSGRRECIGGKEGEDPRVFLSSVSPSRVLILPAVI